MTTARFPTSPPSGYRITGRTVFVALLCFFGLVVAMNGAMTYLAISTLGGVETQSSYRAGLAFAGDIVAAREQADRHWRVAESIVRRSDGSVRVAIEPRDAAQTGLAGLAVSVSFHHPVDGRRDERVALSESKPGFYEGSLSLAPGLWDAVLDVSRVNGETLFRSRNRVDLR
jgi:nitrogen fixation protein FixH